MQVTKEFKNRVLEEANRRFKFKKDGTIEHREEFVIQNFLGILDMEMPMVDHFRNCMRDAMLYKWSSAIVIAIMAGIEDAYKKRGG